MSFGWNSSTAPTLADLITMKPGDNVYFFSKRLVYGIGEVVEIRPGITLAEAFPGITTMDSAQEQSLSSSSSILDFVSLDVLDKPNGKIQRWFIMFKPSPVFYDKGVDMDDLLLSDPPAFRSLRVFWKRTFIKLDDTENLAFKAAILRKNISSLNNSAGFACDYMRSQERLEKSKIAVDAPDIKKLLSIRRNKNGVLGSEMLVELALLNQLSSRDPKTENVFGHWDYLSHQVPASPMKAVDYMDRIDVFGYSWINGYEEKIIDKFLVCELKKDALNPEDASQIMKYVDWVCDEYANGDYSRVSAFLVGSSLEVDEFDSTPKLILRNYITGHRPPENNSWADLTLVTYNVSENGYVEFTSTVKFDLVDI